MYKICYLADSSSLHTKKFCDYFTKQGYEVHVISLNEGFIENANVHNFNFNVKELKNAKTIRKIKYLKAVKEIKKLVNEIKPDIVHAHFASSYGLLGSLINFRPYFISVWGTDIYEFPKKSFLNKCILKYNLKKTDEVLSTSKAMLKETSLYTNKNIHVTPFGIDTNFFKSIDIKKEPHVITLGTVKTLEERYGIEYLLEAFKIVIDSVPDKNLSLVIGGDGSRRESLIKLTKKLGIENYVKFIGYVKEKDIVNVFNSFDIAIFPSLKESFGVAALEAQACGVPVIASDVGGLPEATDPNKSSLLVESKNVQQLSEAIISLVQDDKKRKLMGQYGRNFVCNNFDINENFTRIDKIYIKYLNK
ncbi:glycosyltransferase family 4 protein [Romboutsia sp.]|uniref:glycosyltransferase family 4 protein n=1 Tax=Romboutsia sp. TaxID=1965302 RepID=UPI002B97030F|nr:glycosyltransferase family 4 protein [Romboutsia sp.]HSQ87295.1 glycosyltransferase family 4 protein [Romboutsia sp.]